MTLAAFKLPEKVAFPVVASITKVVLVPSCPTMPLGVMATPLPPVRSPTLFQVKSPETIPPRVLIRIGPVRVSAADLLSLVAAAEAALVAVV